MSTGRRLPTAESLEARSLLSASSFDTTLNGTGKVATAFGSGAAFTAVVTLPDGKVLAAGSVKNGTKHDFLVARYNASGSVDTTFGAGTGRVFTDFGGHDDLGQDLLLVGGGKFVVVGATGLELTNSDFALARYNANGSLDTTFSGDGKQTTDFAGRDDGGAAAALTSDGKLLVVGTSSNNTTLSDIAVARYTATGALDTSLSGGTGKKIFDLGRSGSFPGTSSAAAINVLPSGQFLVGGTIDSSGDSGVNQFDFMLARFNSTGALDTTFGGGKGFVQTTIFGQDDEALAMAVLASGKVLLAGTASEFGGPTDADFAVVRYNANGSLDTGFGGGDGIVTTDMNPAPLSDTRSIDGITGLAVQPNGKILVVGSTHFDDFDASTSFDSLSVARYNANGTLDTSFSGDGKQITSGLNVASAVTPAPDGKTVIAGALGTKAGLVRLGTDFAATASIAGTVYNDLNGGGSRTSGEPGLAGWQVFVDSNSDGFYTPGEVVATTDSSGNYKLVGLLPGTYRIREVRMTNFNRTQPAGAYPLGFYDVTLGVGQAITGKLFGNKHI